MNPNIAKYGVTVCPACNTNSWISPEDSYGLVKVVKENGTTTVKMGTLMTLDTAICSKCGYAKFHLHDMSELSRS